MNDNIIIFGGANREQLHFNDLWIYNKNEKKWKNMACSGDVPTPRSGHAVCGHGKFMFLHGGIDFSEEIAYNDLYILNTGNERSI